MARNHFNWQQRTWDRQAKKRGVLMTCGDCGVQYTNLRGLGWTRSNRAYCSDTCKHRASRRRRWADPEKRAADYLRVAKYARGREHHIRWQYALLTPEEQAQVDAIYNKKRQMNRKAGGPAYHVDHIIPLAKGGAHHPDNLQILTAEENLRKGTRL